MSEVLMSRAEAAERLCLLSEAASTAVRAPDDLAASVLSRARRRKGVRRAAWGFGAGLTVLASVAAFNVGHGDYFAVTQPSGAMAPTVAIAEQVVFSKTATPRPGDVISAHVSADGSNFDLISRVVAEGGDTVSCPAAADGRCDAVIVNGAPIADPYLQALVTDPFPRTTVPDDAVFVLGDARNIAKDSRLIGPVPLDGIEGVAVEIVNSDGERRSVPGAPQRPAPGDDQIVDPADPPPPAGTDPARP